MEKTTCSVASDCNGKQVECKQMVDKAGYDSTGKEPECKELVIDLPELLEPAEWPECCIYRVPKKLREVNEDAYTPKLVSIGPFHHGREELRNMEMQKLRYLKEFCDRTKKTLEELARIIADDEVKIRHSYSETFELKSKEFVNMILLDAVFIINLFWKTLHGEKDNITRKPCLEVGIRDDLILLENQLPFFVLEKLYEAGRKTEKQKEGQDQKSTFLEFSLRYFSSYCKQNIDHESKIMKAKHFTYLIRHLLGSPENPEIGSFENLHCASNLQKSGLKLKAVEERCLLDIKIAQHGCFSCFDCSWLVACLPCLKWFPWLKAMRRVLEVPHFEIDDHTELLFRNVMALEQCHYPYETYVCSYVLLLDYLIDSKDDVDLFVSKDIIINGLGSNAQVAKLINSLGYHIVERGSCYASLAQKLDEHYNYPLNHLIATMKRVYFPDFWRGTGTVIGLIVLGFTFWSFLTPFVR